VQPPVQLQRSHVSEQLALGYRGRARPQLGNV
jgi:hypothetical protein